MSLTWKGLKGDSPWRCWRAAPALNLPLPLGGGRGVGSFAKFLIFYNQNAPPIKTGGVF